MPKPMPRGETVVFAGTSVDVTLPRSVALRDELIVHGLGFRVYTLPLEPPAEPAEGEEAPPPPERHLVGTVTTHWGALATGESELTQVSSAVVQPPAPERKKGSKKKAPKPPPPFTLSLTSSITVVDVGGA